MGELRRHYDRYGWAATQVISAAEVELLRTFLEESWKELSAAYGTRGVAITPGSLSLWTKPVYALLYKPAVVAALKEIMGEDCNLFFPLSVPRNHYTLGKSRFTRVGFHVDSNGEGRAPYLLDPRYRFAKCGIFLQDHDAEWGGTIEVVGGGHRFPLRFGSTDLKFQVKRVYNILGERYWSTCVRLAPGTMVVFDSRLPHASTLPKAPKDVDLVKSNIDGIPPDKTKFVVYWCAGCSEFADGYLSDWVRRSRRELDTPDGQYPFFCDALRLRYPEDYPPDFVAAAAKAGVDVTVPERSVVNELRARFETFIGGDAVFSKWASAYREFAVA